MTSPNIVEWFDDNWMPTRDRAHETGWDSLPRRDQVLLAVGFLLDSCIGDGVWAIVDGVVKGNDEGLTAKMPDALAEVGLPEAAEHIRSIVRLRAPSGSAKKDKNNRSKALEHWQEIHRLFDEWGRNGQRVMLTKLHAWYHDQPEPGQLGSVIEPAKPRKQPARKAKKAR
jgi:hypothetical protein